jgi:hypothetical protein
MSETNTRYREDIFAWSKEQAEALRSAGRDGSNQRLDRENLAEEIESVGISQLSQLRAKLAESSNTCSNFNICLRLLPGAVGPNQFTMRGTKFSLYARTARA